MKQYLDLIKDVLENGKHRGDRTGTGTIQKFGTLVEYPLTDGFPLMTTKEISWNHIPTEVLWYLTGQTNIKYLVANGCNVWNADAYRHYTNLASANDVMWNSVMHQNADLSLRMFTREEFDQQMKMYTEDTLPSVPGIYMLGDLGNVYGKIWRNENGVDQLHDLIVSLKTNPEGRRHIINGWVPSMFKGAALPPCHAFTQWNIREEHGDSILDCMLYIRSNDLALGHPYNVATYALMMNIIGAIVNPDMKMGNLSVTIGDTHIYANHIEGIEEQLKRTPSKLPTLKTTHEAKAIFDRISANYKNARSLNILEELTPDMFTIDDYSPQDRIKFKLNVGV